MMRPLHAWITPRAATIRQILGILGYHVQKVQTEMADAYKVNNTNVEHIGVERQIKAAAGPVRRASYGSLAGPVEEPESWVL